MKINKLQDIHNVYDDKKRILFLQTNTAKQSKSVKYGELFQTFAFGIVILLCLNLINIYNRGTVIKNNVLTQTASAVNFLLEGKEKTSFFELAAGEKAFTAAAQHFAAAINDITFLQTNQDMFMTQEANFLSAQNLLEAGKNISLAGLNFTQSVKNLWQLKNIFAQIDRTLQNPEKKTSFPQFSLTANLRESAEFFKKSHLNLISADKNLASVNKNIIPQPYGKKLHSVDFTVKQLLEKVEKIENFIMVMLKLLGDRDMHRYLILLQNDAEARPTGGFIGSIILMDIYKGHIVKNEFHDVYEFDGQLHENIPAPEDIAKISNNWSLRDANFSPDFAISAEKVAWFLQKEKGHSVDTVIAVNQHLVGDLFEITGPVKLENLKSQLTKENYQSIISYIVESKLNGKNDPKGILREFIPDFQKKLLATNLHEKLFTILASATAKKDILFYSRDDDVQELFKMLGIDGQVSRTTSDSDYLQVVNTSIGGNKSDAYIEQNIEHISDILPDGQVIDQLTITRKHLYTAENSKRLKKMLKSFGFQAPTEMVENILGKGTNKSSVKIYLPMGSVLLDSEGVDKKSINVKTDNYLEKTFFAFETQVEAGQESIVKISYVLPQKLDLTSAANYRFFIQRQPSMLTGNFNKIILLQQGTKVYGKYPPELTQPNETTLKYSGLLEKDVYMASLVGS